MFEPWPRLLLGLLTGIVFGFLLQKGRVAKYQTILDQFRLKDWTVVKVMGTAVVVGSVGIYALLPTEAVSLHIKPLWVGGIVVGGILFGLGMAVLGYCPGTGVAACGEGRRDAMVGVLGMLAGAGVYIGLYGVWEDITSAFGNQGSLTFPRLTSTSPWWWIGALLLGGGAAVALSSRLGRVNASESSRQDTETPRPHITSG